MTSSVLQVADSVDAAFTELYELGFTDGLPVIPPTRELVERMLATVDADPSTVVARVPPLLGEASLEKIAANAVMAGCLPEYLPVLVAAVRGMCRPDFNLHGMVVSGDPSTPGLILNGPIRSELDVNCGENAAGPGRRANATLGRAIRLIITNIGGAVAGVHKTMIGQPAMYGFCVGENEEDSPWVPFHVERGFEPTQSTVTVAQVMQTEYMYPLALPAEAILDTLVQGMTVIGHANVPTGAFPVSVIVPPAQAAELEKHGFTKDKVKEYIWEHARVPVKQMPPGEKSYYWPPRYLDRLTIENDEVLVVKQPDDVSLFVVGGRDYATFLYLGGWESIPSVELIAG